MEHPTPNTMSTPATTVVNSRRMALLGIPCVASIGALIWWFYPEEPFTVDGPPKPIEGLTQAEQLHFDSATDGVTAENNMALVLLQIVDPTLLAKRRRPKLLEMLSISHLSSRQRVFIDPDSEELDGEFDRVQLARAALRRWSRDEFPGIADYVDANKFVLDKLVSEQHRDRYYMPFLRDEDPLGQGMFTVILNVEEVWLNLVKLLCIRGNLSLNEGNVDAALTDFLTAWRVALLLQRSPAVITCETAVPITYASKAIRRVVRIERLSDQQLDEVLARIDDLPSVISRRDLAESFRPEMVDTVQTALNSPERVDWVQTFLTGPAARGVDVWAMADSDAAIKRINELHDVFADAVSEPIRKERRTRLDALVAEAAAWIEGEELNQPRSGEDPEDVGRWIGQTLFFYVIPAWEPMEDLICNATTQLTLTRSVIALEKYRRKHDSYPESTAGLVPEFSEARPIDAFMEHELQYERNDNGYLLSVDPDILTHNQPGDKADYWTRLKYALRKDGLQATTKFDRKSSVD